MKSEGKDALTILASSEGCTVAADSAGVLLPGAEDAAYVTFRCFRGDAELTAGVNFGIVTVVASEGLVFDKTSDSVSLVSMSTAYDFGWCDINIGVDGIIGLVTRRFTVSKSRQGVPGSNGENGYPGNNGKGIESIVEYYLASQSASGVTVATSGWSTSVQSITNTKRYLWSYQETTYTDNSFSRTTPVVIGVYGDTGQTGATGALYLPRGEWNADDTYTKTLSVIMYVIYEGYCYEVNVASITGGNTPLYDVQNGLGNWKSMGRHDVVATRVLLANFALLAGGVHWNNRLMSQYGVDANGDPSTSFTDYSEDAGGNPDGNFRPNTLIDFLNGRFRSLDATILGILRTAESGARIEIGKDRNALHMYDAADNARVTLAPKPVQTLNEVLNPTPGYVTLSAKTDTVQSNENGYTLKRLTSTETITLLQDRLYTITVPPIIYSVSASSGTSLSTIRSASKVYVSLEKQILGRWYEVSRVRIAHVESTGVRTVSNNGESQSQSVSGLQKGSYRITITLEVYNQDTTYNCLSTASASITSGSLFSFVSLSNMVEMGLNGLNLVNSLENYFHFGEDLFKIQFGERSLRVDDSGIHINGLRHGVVIAESGNIFLGGDAEYVFCKNSSPMGVVLPSDGAGATPGQVVYIGKLGAGYVVISGPFMRNGSTETTSINITENGKWAKFAYDGDNWYFMHYNQ